MLVSTNGIPVYQGPSTVARTDQDYLVLSPIRLPSGDLPFQSNPGEHEICIQARIATTSSHTLTLDYLLLLPQDSFNHYQSLTGLPTSALLIDDAFAEKCWSKSSGSEFISHLRSGSNPMINGGYLARFFVFQAGVNGLSPIDRSISVRAYYRERRILL